jgi:RNA polymerase sigma-54 factor
MSKQTQNLDLRNTQNLVMTPQLQQAIRILQLNNIELNEFIDEELAKNPLLEKQDDFEDDTIEKEDLQDKKDEISESFDNSWTGNEATNTDHSSDFDSGSAMATSKSGGDFNFNDSDMNIEARLTKPLTLREVLIDQLNLSFTDSKDILIGSLLIDKLDESGYLRIDSESLSSQLNCSLERVSNILTTLKKFEPTGVFAKDLIECLSLQLEEQNKLDDPMKTLLEHLDLLANREFKRLEEICSVNSTYLLDMVEEIKELNPKPASKYEHLVVQTVIPDVLMKKLPKNLGGGWRVELNSDTLPKVLINQEYYTEVLKSAKSKKDKSYLDHNLQSANWIIKAMDQRAKTILKVASEIIEEQEGFFLYGIEFLRPLTLKDIAEKIDMHESTVSRVTNNKYIGTPRGVFELKYFFTSSLSSKASSESFSSEAVKAKIKNLIDNEGPDSILSDDKIVQTLQDQGIDIARRTVAKYREALNIPSSVQRRRLKKN